MQRSLGLQDRILAWYGGTVLGVLALVLLLVQVQVSRETSQQVAERMDSARRVVESLQRERMSTLALVAGLAGREPKLGAAMASDPVTILALLREDLQHALQADFIRVADARGHALADTSGRVRPYTDLTREPDVHAALRGNVPRGMLIHPGELYLVATAPIQVGGQDLGTVTVGRRVSDEIAGQLYENTGSEVTYFTGGRLAATSWPVTARTGLLSAAQWARTGKTAHDGARSFSMTLGGRRLMCLLIPVVGEGGATGMLLIQGNLDAALQPYRNTQRALELIGLMGLLAALLGSVIVAGGVTKPLQRIARAAQGLMQGDWSQRTPVTSRDEVGLLAETFNRMAERLESWDSDMRAAVAERTRELDAAYQLMRQFNADASHELRTPLTVIRGEAEVALRAQRSGPEYQAVLHTIQEETERMSRIIEQLMLLARADSGELRLERRPVALDDLARDVSHRAEVLARARHIHLRTGPLEAMLLDGDEDQLSRLTLNLIDNAIKYTPEGGEVSVSLHAEASVASPTGTEAVLAVTDTGMGIDARHLPHIFNRFYRVDKARSRTEGGSGLGLAICRWIAQAHGGRIEVRSRPGAGSTFTVRLPATAVAVEDSPSQLTAVQDGITRDASA